MPVPVTTRIVGSLALSLAVAAIGWLDYITGPDIGFSLFYLIPIGLAGWFFGVIPAIVVAGTAGVSWLLAELHTQDLAIAVTLWNGFTRLFIYNSEGILVALLRRDRDEMKALVEHEGALARTDTITKLPNSRAFFELLDAEL